MAKFEIALKPVKDEATKTEILRAFRKQFPNIPLNDDGSPKFTDEEWVAHHIQNFIREQVKRTREQSLAEQRAATDKTALNVADIFSV